MINVNNLSLRYGKRVLFEDVNLKFTEGNCYGIIGANGAGKSTFIKILSGEIDPTGGKVDISKGMRMSVLKQDHHKYNETQVLETVIMGNTELYSVMKEKDAIYAKEDFTEEDGLRAGELEGIFAEMDGWNAESDAATLLSNLGVSESKHYANVQDLDGNEKVRVLLAQALFGNPDILLLDEPTNDLDLQTIGWLENFLADYDKIVLVVSHDRHFLDTVCTHVADIDFGKITIFTGNYSFWYESSQLLLKQRTDQNKKAEDKIAELKEFIARFSANASKSKQATSRKKALDKIKLEDMTASTRKYPAILFNNQVREAGDQILEVKGLSKTLNGEVLFKDVNFDMKRGQKLSVLSENSLATTAFYKILSGEDTDFEGEFKWGVTITPAYLPGDNTPYFEGVDLNLVDWLRQYSEEKDETFIRGFLGRMLFSGEETQKKCNVLSGGEKVRCMLSRMMMQKGNLLMFDEPTNHLDLESITALNNGMNDFRGTVIFTSRDHELTQTVADRIIEISPNGMLDKDMTFDEYISDERVAAQREELHKVNA
ncbi:ABC-F family ATP-binding cassette domain-containing protein [Edaphocola flava]|jgi:ATPase subunit of ABC transporter with duplicated ATPase domains|uniref:ABC-F family ATP-binding cassette domain-containing protein n=1 Tax=Edaphocola flava TaxID=2499629 RepID=UPI00100B2535|nr:ATP-binding cassette domain-containing protein [Edaphocola flava]